VRFVQAARDNLEWGQGGPPPLLVKIAPDLSEDDKADIAAVAAATRVDGLVVGNTTVTRPGGRGGGVEWCAGRIVGVGRLGC
jgi:dihydroorotate dehydrogenase